MSAKLYKVIILSIHIIFELVLSNNIQIKMVTRSYADIPVFGRVNQLKTTYLSNNQKNTIETTDLETRFFGFIAGLVSDIKDTTGKLIDHKGEEWEYNINNKEYWISSDKSKNTSEEENEKSKKIEFSIGSDDESSEENKLISVMRVGNEEMENIHGFKTKKWTTTFQFSEYRIIIDEWSIKELSLLRLADSLNRQILISKGVSDTLIAISRYGIGLSNNELILGATKLDSIYHKNGILPIEGEIIKGDVKKIENGDQDHSMSFGIEIVELYAEDFAQKNFIIPDNYEFVD